MKNEKHAQNNVYHVGFPSKNLIKWWKPNVFIHKYPIFRILSCLNKIVISMPYDVLQNIIRINSASTVQTTGKVLFMTPLTTDCVVSK